ncbi:MAG: glycosyltransferase [Lachnospiraceae bacterium]|nr:glycosyltransferase [Lachnospiraceae bacterium]
MRGKDCKRILLLFHNLEIEGAPITLANAGRILVEEGYEVAAFSPSSGEMAGRLDKAIELTCADFDYDEYPEEYDAFFKGFDLVIANTIMMYRIVERLEGEVPLIWYLHEGRLIKDYFIKIIPGLREILRNTANVVVVSRHVKEFLLEENLVDDCFVVENFVEDHVADMGGEAPSRTGGRKVLTLIGTVNYNKGFDLAIQAFHQLDEKDKEKIHLNFVGKISDQSYYGDCLKVLDEGDPITWTESVQGQEKWALFRDTDVFLVPSRDESSSLVALEACMCKKPLILSQNVGAKYMVSPENGWIFPNEDVEALADILRQVILSDDLDSMGEASRRKYEKYATENIFREKIGNLAEQVMQMPLGSRERMDDPAHYGKKVLLVNLWYQKDYPSCLEAYAMEKILQGRGFVADTAAYVPVNYREECRTSFPVGFAQRNLSLQRDGITRDQLSRLAEDYDAVVVGPGQVWGREDASQMGGFLNWLDFASDGQVRIACCVNFDGQVQDFLEANPAIAHYFLEKMDGISVCDRSSQKKYMEAFGEEVPRFPSPMFLLSREEWKEVIGRNRNFCPYCLIDLTCFEEDFVREQGEHRGMLPAGQTWICNDHKSQEMEVEEWLSSIYYASAVIGDSYGAVCAALLLGKEVLYLGRRNDGTDGVKTMLRDIISWEGVEEADLGNGVVCYSLGPVDVYREMAGRRDGLADWLADAMDRRGEKKGNPMAEEFVAKLIELEGEIGSKDLEILDITARRDEAFVERDKREQFLIEENQKTGREKFRAIRRSEQIKLEKDDLQRHFEGEINVLRSSTIWKTGSAITWVPRQVKDVIQGRKKINVTSKLRTMGRFREQYGMRGLLRAIGNKVTGKPLDYKIAVPMNPMSKDDVGRRIFQEQQNELSPDEMWERMESFERMPKLSIIMPIYNAPVKWLEVAVRSLQAQVYENWELCAVNDGSPERAGFERLLQMAEEDDRIRCLDREKNQGISGASNDALDMAEGEYVLLMDQDDEITPDALFWFVHEINLHRDAEFVYSDECKVDGERGTELSYFICKPDWSPEMMLNQMYTGHMSMYLAELVRKAGGFRSEYDFSQDYDLALRMSRLTENIYHLERILYFWRSVPTSSAAGGKDYARESNINALKDYLTNQGIRPVMQKNPYANYAYMMMEGQPKVTMVVPSDSCENMMRTVNGILDCTEYDAYEIILVTNSGAMEEMGRLCHSEKVKYCPYDLPYNFSAKCNAGAEMAEGEFVVFYNDDVIPRKKDWLVRLLELFELEGVGGVSPMLVYEDNTIQYAGMISGVRGQVGTSFHMRHFENIDYWFHQYLVRDVSILSGACVAIRTALFREIGGFDAEHTPSAHSDIDLSYKLLEREYRCVYTPYSLMTHIGNHSWAVKGVKEKAPIYCLKRWGKYISQDPYFTESMKNLFYYTDQNYFQIFSPEKELFREHEGKDILFLTHELTRTGAPVQLLNMVKATMQKMNYFPVVVSPEDGPMKQDFLDLGITVIVDMELPISATNLDRYARDYDLIVVNTMSPICIDAINELRDTLPPILWWIHEGEYAFGLFRAGLQKELHDKVHLFCASEYSQRILLDYSQDYQSEIIRCGVEDFGRKLDVADAALGEKKVFLVIGTIEWRKGQDILLDAIAGLAEDVRDKAEFYFIGRQSDEKMMQKLSQGQKRYSCVRYMDVVPQKELLEYYKKASGIIVPSRDEPTSLTAIEGMTLSKPCIVSDKTGISEVMENGKSAYIFRNENVTELIRIIESVTADPERAAEIGREGRKVYERLYTMEKFSARCVEVLEEIMD